MGRFDCFDGQWFGWSVLARLCLLPHLTKCLLVVLVSLVVLLVFKSAVVFVVCFSIVVVFDGKMRCRSRLCFCFDAGAFNGFRWHQTCRRATE